MNTQNVWIKRSEREPKCSDLPIVTGYRYDSGGWQQSAWFCVPPNTSDSPYTHWRSIKADPPPRELTQRERDVQWANDLSVKVIERCALVTRPLSIEHTLAGIYAERREVAKLMADWFRQSDWGTHDGISPQCKAIRARLDEQGAK